MQMDRIDGRDITRIHEHIGIATIAVTIGILKVLVSSRQVNTCFQPLFGLEIHRHTGRKTVKTRVLQITVLIEIA